MLKSVFLFLLTCCTINAIAQYEDLLAAYKKAINNRDYMAIEGLLNPDFVIKNMDRKTSLIQFYSYILFNKPDSHLIEKITVTRSEPNGDTSCLLTGLISYRGGNAYPFNFLIRRKSDKMYTLVRINSGWIPPFNFTTRASLVEDEVFGNDPIANIKKLTVVDYEKYDTIGRNGYKIYFEKQWREEAYFALTAMTRIDSVLASLGVNKIKREPLLLTSEARSTVTVGTHSDMPWTMSLNKKGGSVQNKRAIDDKISHTISHEIAENSLVNNYNLSSIRYRWFRDGLAELTAYNYSRRFNKEVAASYFVKERLREASKYQQMGNLLDWRGAGPNEQNDVGVLYGDKYIYENEVGQYGRAFKFFLYLQQEYGDAKLVQLLDKIDRQHKSITREDLLKLFNDIYGIQIVSKIGEY